MKKLKSLYILCGGESRRMGKEKFSLEYQGKTFLDHILKKSLPLFDRVILLGANRSIPGNLPRIPDAMDNSGPLGGLLAALQHSSEASIAMIPVDLPLISKDTLNRLNKGATQNKAALVAKSKERVQPLVGIYQTRLAPELEKYLSSGKRSVMGLIDEIDYGTFRVSDEEIVNINTPEEYKNLLSTRRCK